MMQWCKGLHVCFPSKHLHLCCSGGSSLDGDLNFEGFSMWYFIELIIGDFQQVLWFPPLLQGLLFSVNEINLRTKCGFYSVKIDS